MAAKGSESESTTWFWYGEYEIQLVESLSIAFQLTCPICLGILEMPTLTSCCGEHFCARCIDRVKEDNRPCPTCSYSQFITLLDRKTQRKIEALLITCVNKNKGCDWEGQFQYLENHLSTNSSEGDCKCVMVECPLHCGKSYARKEVESHTKNDCPQRNSSCPYCPFRGTYQIVTNDHIPVCLYYPVRCPNDCGVTCEREDVEYHLKNICDEERITCKFSAFGCDEHFKRRKVEEHMQSNVQKHLSLLADTTLRLLEGSQLSGKAVQAIDVESDPIQHQVDKLSTAVQELHVKDKGTIEANKVDHNFSAIYPSNHRIVLANFKQKMHERDCINTDLIYSHEKGYKFMLQVWPYGDGKVIGTHVSADIYPVPGDYDHQLLWPVNLTFTFVVIDQSTDQNNLKREVQVVWNKEDVGMFFSEHSFELVAHSRLEDSTGERAQFIKDGTVLLQYTQVQVHY